MDQDGDGFVTLHEFLGEYMDEIEEMKEAFNAADSDGDGKIT